MANSYKVHIAIPFTWDIEANNAEDAQEQANALCRQAEKEVKEGNCEALVIEVERI